MTREILRIERVTCKEQEQVVLDNVNLVVKTGEIVGVYSAASYGITELIDLIRYNRPLYYGYVYYMEILINSWKKSGFGNNRIAVVESETSLVNGQTILTNVFVLRDGFSKEIISNTLLRKQIMPYIDDIGIPLDPDMPVENLNSFDRIIVEILRAVVAGYHLIVLREIDSMLSEEEFHRLHKIMLHYASQGKSFLFISFDPENIKKICSRYYVISNGRTVMNYESPYEDPAQKKSGSEGESEIVNGPMKRELRKGGKESLRKIEISLTSGRKLCMYPGECAAVYLRDEGMYRRALEELFQNDIEKQIQLIEGHKAHFMKMRQLAIIREQPETEMIFSEMSCIDNLCLAMDHRVPEIWYSSKMKRNVCQEYTGTLGFEIFGRSAGSLTKEERIKLVYARIQLQQPILAICAQPFRGYDPENRKLIYECMRTLMDHGIAVLIVTTKKEEAFYYADRNILF